MTRIKVLSWNINRKTVFEAIVNDITTDVDILILTEAENVIDASIEATGRLQRISLIDPSFQNHLTPRVYASNSRFNLTHFYTAPSRRMSAYTLSISGAGPIIFWVIHFPSKAEYNSETQEDLANTYISWINEIENLKKTKRSIVCGDFNMNPFELGMVKPKGFNATLSKEIVKTDRVRRFHFQDYDYFYNPMWNFMGDHIHSKGTSKLPGSYHFTTTTDVEITYWNVFDKVIVRHEVLDNLDLSSINLLQNRNGHIFTDSNYTIDSNTYSDHLPLLFDLIF
jgi:exonuclease III